MSSLEKAVETQKKNIEMKIGKTIEELGEFIRKLGLTRHSEIRLPRRV